MTTEFNPTDEHVLWVEEAAAKLPSNVREALKACACAHAAFEDVLQPFRAADVSKYSKLLHGTAEELEKLDAEAVKAAYIADVKASREFSALFSRKFTAANMYYKARDAAVEALVDFFIAPMPED